MHRLLLYGLILNLILTACSPVPEAQYTALPSQPPPSPQPSATVITQSQPPPTDSPAPPRRSVFVISWDGAQAEMIQELMADGTLPHFAALAKSGVQAEYAQSVDPSLTAAAQNSISTGSYPSHTGMVSNSFHNPTDSFYWYRRGFDELLDQAEPVWVTASRAGLKTAALFFTGGSPLLPGQTADYTIGYGVRDAYSLQEKLTLQPAGSQWSGDLPASFSPPQEGSFTIREVSQVYLYVIDSTDDQAVNYDAAFISTARRIEPGTVRLSVGEWGQVILMPTIVAGADFLLQAIDQSGGKLKVTLFYSGVYHNTAAPRAFLEELNQKFGYFPAGADSYAMEHGWLTPQENQYLLERAATWMAEVSAWVYTTYRPDLLYTWQDGFDAAGHAYWMKDPRQPGYSPEKAQEFAAYYRQAAQANDRALEIMLEAIDLQQTSLLLVADHGMAPIYSTVYVNTILQQAGLLKLDSKDYVIVKESQAFAVASGGAAHIYINLKGREKDGFVLSEDYTQIEAQIIDLFSSLTDPQSGETVFQRVVAGEQLAALHLDHFNSGAVFVQARPGYHLDGWRGKPVIFETPAFYGQHGYDSTLPEMHTMFIACGAGIPKGETIPAVQIVDYAPTIAAWLGFAPAATVDGSPIAPLLAP